MRMAEQSSCKAGMRYGDRLNEPSPVYINGITCSETHYSSSSFVVSVNCFGCPVRLVFSVFKIERQLRRMLFSSILK